MRAHGPSGQFQMCLRGHCPHEDFATFVPGRFSSTQAREPPKARGFLGKVWMPAFADYVLEADGWLL